MHGKGIEVNNHYWHSLDPLSVPNLIVDRVTNSAVEYQVRRNDMITNAPLITGYKVIRLGVPMVGQYENAGRGRRVTISPAVPGAQYRITAWALGDSRRSATPAVLDVTTGVESECDNNAAYDILIGQSRCMCNIWLFVTQKY